MAVKAAADSPRPRLDDRERRAAESSGTGDDLRLVESFLAGERAAIEEISRWILLAGGRHRGRLSWEWDDVVQDLLLEVTAVLRDGGFRGESTLRTFIWRIVHYRCLNRIRDAGRRPENEPEDNARQVADPQSLVLDRMLRRESENRLLRFMDSISEDCHRLWRLILAGRSYREMSHELGVSEGALRVRVLRCRQKAVREWKKWLESTDG